MSKALTENSYLAEKVSLRIQAVNEIPGNSICVLDCFSADGTLWYIVKRQSSKQIKVLRIEKRKDAKGTYLAGDNIKYLMNMDLSKFEIIDLDAYGFAINQLDIIFEKSYKGIIVLTFIQLFNSLSYKMLYELGFTKAMINKCRTMICNNPVEKLNAYLSRKGVKEMRGYFMGTKNYFYIQVS